MKNYKYFLATATSFAAIVSMAPVGIEAAALNDAPSNLTEDDVYSIFRERPIVEGKTVKEYSLTEFGLLNYVSIMKSNYEVSSDIYRVSGTSYDGTIQIEGANVDYNLLMKRYPTEEKLKEKSKKLLNEEKLKVNSEDFYPILKKFYNELKPGKVVDGYTIQPTNFLVTFERKIDLDTNKAILYLYIHQNDKLLHAEKLNADFKGYTARSENINFTDVKEDSWAKPHIDNLVKLGIVQGKTPTTFSPSSSITRAQFAAMLARTIPNMKADFDFSERLTDASKKHWAYNDIALLHQLGVMQGTTVDDKVYINPEKPITRQQAAAMVVRYLDQAVYLSTDKVSASTPFADVNSISDYAKDSIGKLYTLGVISGSKNENGETVFNPSGNLTRAQMSKIVDNILNLVPDKDLGLKVNKQ